MALLAGCPANDKGDGDPQGSSSTGGAPATDGDPTATGAPVTDSGEPDTDTDTDEGPASDSGDDTAGTDTVGDDTAGTVGDDTAGDDTGPAVPGECVETDPAVSAAFTLDLGTWPLDPDEHSLVDIPCVVDEVTSAGGTVSTALSCMHEGEARVATLDVAEAPEGPVAWIAGDAVQLTSIVHTKGIDEEDTRDAKLRGVDDSLLMSGINELGGDGVESQFKPLEVHFDPICMQEDGEYPVRIEFDPIDAPSLFIFSGHRGLLETGSDADFAIDVEKAISNGLHDIEFKVLLRRVIADG